MVKQENKKQDNQTKKINSSPVFNKRVLTLLALAAVTGATILAVRSCDKLPLLKSSGTTPTRDKGALEQPVVPNVAPNKAAVVKQLDSLLTKYKLNEPGSAEKLYTFLNDGVIATTEDYDDALTKYNALVIQSYYDSSTEIIDLVAASQPNLESQTEVLKAKASIKPLIDKPNRETTALFGLNALATINGYDDEYRGQFSRSHLLVTELYRNAYVIVAENNLERTTLDLKKVDSNAVTATPLKLKGKVLFTVSKLSKDLVTEERTALMQDNAELVQEIKVRTRK